MWNEDNAKAVHISIHQLVLRGRTVEAADENSTRAAFVLTRSVCVCVCVDVPYISSTFPAHWRGTQRSGVTADSRHNFSCSYDHPVHALSFFSRVGFRNLSLLGFHRILPTHTMHFGGEGRLNSRPGFETPVSISASN